MSVHEIVIHVGEAEAAVDFYTRVCGFAYVRTVTQRGTKVVELDAQGQRVTLVEIAAPGMRLALLTDDAKAQARRLRRRKVEPDGEPVEVDGGVWLGFSDPWGNRLGFFEDRSAP